MLASRREEEILIKLARPFCFVALKRKGSLLLLLGCVGVSDASNGSLPTAENLITVDGTDEVCWQDTRSGKWCIQLDATVITPEGSTITVTHPWDAKQEQLIRFAESEYLKDPTVKNTRITKLEISRWLVHPKYRGLTDKALANLIYHEYYSDLDRDVFDRRIGLMKAHEKEVLFET